MRELTETKIFTAIVHKYSYRTSEGFDFGEDTHRKQWGADKKEVSTWNLVFGTYAPNVSEPPDYTVEDAIDFANDPKLLEVFPPPFYVTKRDGDDDRPTLFFGRHASGLLADWVQQPGEYPMYFLVVKPSMEEPAFPVDVLSMVSECRAPEKHMYGCKSCLESSEEFEQSCVVKKFLCPKEDPLANHVSWKIAPLLASRKNWVKDHIFISPVMLHSKSEQKFQGLKDIKFENLDFSYYQEHYEKKCEALVERRRTLNNVKVYCKKCSVYSDCSQNFKYKRRSCCNPLPDLSLIATEIINRASPRISKKTIAEILEASGRRKIRNPKTGRTSDATIGLSELNRGLGFCVHRMSDNQIMTSGVTDEEWDAFKRSENLNIHEKSVEQNLENLEDPEMFATVLSCANVRYSPVRVSMWRSTQYEYMYTSLTYSKSLIVYFHMPSRRGIAPWSFDVRTLSDLFSHYGKIPGSRW